MLRFAPSTTSDIDIKDLRYALFNHILSKKLNEELLIRIDDTDKEKNIEGKDKEIIEMLQLFGIDYSRVLHQSENIKYHTQMAMKLLLEKKAFNCFCSDEALENDKQIAKKENKPYRYSGFCETISDETKFNCNAPFVVRLKTPEENIEFIDLLKGEHTYESSDIDSVIILKHDKSPTSTFASSVDDMLFNISTVITEETNNENVAEEIHVRQSLGYDQKINYLQLAPILEAEHSLKSLIDDGYLPAAIANYVILLGYKTTQEIFSIEDILQEFDIAKINQQPVTFDIKKLNEINRKYMNRLDDMRFSKIISFADTDIGKLAKLYIKECNTTKEIEEKIKTIFSKKDPSKELKDSFLTLQNCLKNAPFIQEFDDLQKYIEKNTELKDEQLSQTLSFALTGKIDQENLSEIYPLIQNYLGEIIK